MNAASEQMARAAAQLAAVALQSLEASSAINAGRPRSFRFEAPVPTIDSLAWLEAQTITPKVYWRDRAGELAVAAVGAADVLHADEGGALSPLMRQLHANLASANLTHRYYGGMRFDAGTRPADHWRVFGACRFVLPQIELHTRGERTHLACNVLHHEGYDPAQERQRLADTFGALVFPPAFPVPQAPSPKTRQDRPAARDWRPTVLEALARIRAGHVDKVVLARESEFLFDETPNPLTLLRLLACQAPDACHFCFQPAEDSAFFGASPELLYKRQSRYVQSEALAGTRPRGEGASDQLLEQELLANDKERREHAFVENGLREAFEALCSSVQVETEPSVIRLAHCQHLRSRIEGLLADTDADEDLLRAFHPSPAVGGYPPAPARDCIRELDAFDRGWYAGPVGWVGYDAAEFAVGIRSALVHGPAMSVYAGAGIVAGSRPDAEWDEIESKIRGFTATLPAHDS